MGKETGESTKSKEKEIDKNYSCKDAIEKFITKISKENSLVVVGKIESK
jgi:hypothetical protein